MYFQFSHALKTSKSQYKTILCKSKSLDLFYTVTSAWWERIYIALIYIFLNYKNVHNLLVLPWM